MKTPTKTRIPGYLIHRATGQARVRLSGKDIYLGTHNSSESRSRYERFVAEWLANGRKLKIESDHSAIYKVADLIDDFISWAEKEYRLPTGEMSREVINVKYAFRDLYELFADLPASEFGPKSLLLYRDRQITNGLTRKTINQRVGIIRRLFRFATREERVSATVYHALTSVEGLKRGRCSAREGEGVKPVPEDHIANTLPQLSPTIRAMIEIQLLSGMRPGEVVLLRPRDLDRSGPIWIFRPTVHKNAWRGHVREIMLGPRAQTILQPYLLRREEDYCFSPEEVVESLYTTKPKDESWRAPGTCYTTLSYARAIARACKRAKVSVWSPGQLRHNSATRIRQQFGLEAAGAILGHRILETTQVYCESSRNRAQHVANLIG